MHWNCKKIREFFPYDKLDSPSVMENSASAMLDVSREESDLFQQNLNLYFWWRQLAAGRSLNCASCPGGW